MSRAPAALHAATKPGSQLTAALALVCAMVVSYLAQVLTILKFQPNDVIIEAGEESSFVGIVLAGVLVSGGKTTDAQQLMQV